jgi:inorganic pyrophosphatase
MRAVVVGGLQVMDKGEADDKIVAVLEGDYVWGGARDIQDLPGALLERLIHYFDTYKLVPGEAPKLKVKGHYGYEHAVEVIRASFADYKEKFGEQA